MKRNPSINRLIKAIRKDVKLRGIVFKKVYPKMNTFLSRRKVKKAAQQYYQALVDKP